MARPAAMPKPATATRIAMTIISGQPRSATASSALEAARPRLSGCQTISARLSVSNHPLTFEGVAPRPARMPFWEGEDRMISRRSAVLTFLAAVSASAVPVANPAPLADLTHAKEVEQWRAKHEADYRNEYVPLAGLFFLKPGRNTAGSAASSDIMLPKRAPASVGDFVYEKPRIRFEPRSGSPVTLKGKPV